MDEVFTIMRTDNAVRVLDSLGNVLSTEDAQRVLLGTMNMITPRS